MEYRFMQVKVDSIHNTEKFINITKLDIDDYGTMILLVELEFKLLLNDDHNRDRKNSQYAILSVQEDLEENDSTINSAETMTRDELNKERQKIIEIGLFGLYSDH
jgi:hypothetical protein